MSKRSFDNYSGSYKVISVTANRLLKTQYIEKKRAGFPVKKLFPCFCAVSQITNVNERNIRVQMVFDIFCASYKFISIGPKRSFETNISKKSMFPVTKISAFFFSFYQKCQTSGNNFLASLRYSDIVCEVVRLL